MPIKNNKQLVGLSKGRLLGEMGVDELHEYYHNGELVVPS
jgi:hypothetical protein